MKKNIRNMYLVSFVIFICLPRFLWLIFGRYANSANYENRTLASRPAFHIETYETYPSEYEAFFNDRLPFRNELISLNSWVNYQIFKTSINDNVILGKDKWLFYTAVSDGNPIGDYEGNIDFSDEERKVMGDAVLRVQNRFRDMGICFAVLIPPNKERIYPQYMPDRYVCSETSRSDRMIDELMERNINIINPKEELLKLRSEYQLYYPYDTHWNQLGAYVGTCSVLKSWGIKTADLHELTILTSKHENDDLANMLNLSDTVFNDATEYVIQRNIEQETQISNELVHFKNPEALYDKSIFLLGDSYRTAMNATLCLYFSDVYIAEHGNYTYDMLEQAEPDYLIVEYIERHSDRLAKIEEFVFGQ